MCNSNKNKFQKQQFQKHRYWDEAITNLWLKFLGGQYY